MLASQNLTRATVLTTSSPSAQPSFSNRAAEPTTLVRYATGPPCSGRSDTFLSCGATDEVKRAARAGNDETPVEATSVGMVDRASDRSESDGDGLSSCDDEVGTAARRCSVASSAAKGAPDSTLCSSALTAVKILRARTASPRACRREERDEGMSQHGAGRRS